MLHAPFEEGASLRDAVRRARAVGAGARLRIEGLRAGARAFLIAEAYRAEPTPLLVLAGTAEAEALASDLAFFLGEDHATPALERRVQLFPAWDVPAFEPVSPSAAVVADRIAALFYLLQGKNPIVVTTPEAILQRLMPRAVLADAIRYLVEGDELAVEALAPHLVAWGYQRVPVVEDRGELSVRGGLVDVFPLLEPEPLRIELDGDRIESIRSFDPDTQRSRDAREECVLLPVRELSLAMAGAPEVRRAIETRALEIGMPRLDRHAMSDALENGLFFPGIEQVAPYVHPDGLATLLDYLPAGVRLWVDDAAQIESAWDAVVTQVETRAREAEAARRFAAPVERAFLSPQAARGALGPLPTVELDPLVGMAGVPGRLQIRCHTVAELGASRAHLASPSIKPVADCLRTWIDEGRRILLAVPGGAQRARLQKLLEPHGVHAAIATERVAALLDGGGPVTIVDGALSEGFRLPSEPWVLVSEEEIFGERRQRRRARTVSAADILSSLAELKTDDFVVHVDHGIGLYRGLKHLAVAGTEGDYLHLEYLGGDRLYVPVDRINLVQKYIGASDGAAPSLDKLGGTTWERVKAKTREALLSMARELVETGARRQVLPGHVYDAQDDPLYREFEARFPFDETPDQQRAIEEVLADLGAEKPMDRLVCGDVGFGKTEVAMRAAFVVVNGGRQVAVLVPTTVLAQQHFDSFRARFAGYPIVVEMLSRFRSTAENKAVVQGLADGTVDVVIGTHRLLQKDVQPRNLGLLVIDEEHRFGVRDKERIKALRSQVDVVTLTATPIPRTLQMALTGIRDLSVIESPPVDRLAIRTYVTRADDDVIREAILREIRRGGQVFFVHNRVESIDRRAGHLRELVPEATFLVGHGQMGERQLEQVMDDFMHQRANVLVCSAIIESGLDIPRANTILIDRADTFGLAQLYQLRGRVGRSNVRAYAYLLIPGEHMIGTDAHKRLEALQELDELGGGFRLAAHDLEIRGAGNMLGKQQSGNITAVGFELYTQMMEEAVREVRGETVTTEVEPEIQLGFPAYIPEAYVQDVNQRLILYKRLAGVKRVADLAAIADEMHDRFGPPPPLVDSLLRVMELRRVVKDLLVTGVRKRGDAILFEFHAETPVKLDTLLALQKKEKGQVRLFPDSRLSYLPREHDTDGLVDELKMLCGRLAG